jgi:hypothetical protein
MTRPDQFGGLPLQSYHGSPRLPARLRLGPRPCDKPGPSDIVAVVLPEEG